MTPILNDFQKLSLCGDLSFSKHIMFVNGKEEQVSKLLTQNVRLAREVVQMFLVGQGGGVVQILE